MAIVPFVASFLIWLYWNKLLSTLRWKRLTHEIVLKTIYFLLSIILNIKGPRKLHGLFFRLFRLFYKSRLSFQLLCFSRMQCVMSIADGAQVKANWKGNWRWITVLGQYTLRRILGQVSLQNWDWWSKVSNTLVIPKYHKPPLELLKEKLMAF